MVGYTLLLFLPLLCALPYVNVQLKYINAPDAILLIFIFFSLITFGYHQMFKYGNMILTLHELTVYINDQFHWILKSTKKQSQQKPTILTEAKTTFTFLKTQTFVNCF